MKIPSKLRATLAMLLAAIGTTAAMLPDDWLRVSTDGNVLEFIDSRFKDGDSQERLQSQLSGIRRIDVEPVALRTVFTSLARAVRDRAA